MTSMWPTDHADCSRSLVAHMAEHGTEITVCDRQPLFANRFSTDPYPCPHSTTFWLTPTAG